MSLALYIMSAAISMRRILYMSSYRCSSSSMLVSTTLLGASILCALAGSTCTQAELIKHKQQQTTQVLGLLLAAERLATRDGGALAQTTGVLLLSAAALLLVCPLQLCGSQPALPTHLYSELLRC